MDPYQQTYEELKSLLSEEEIADGYMIPEMLSEKEQQESDESLRMRRFQLMEKRSENQRCLAEITRLRIRLQTYVEGGAFQEGFRFGAVLEAYIQLLRIPKKTFAAHIGLHHTKLSRIIHGKDRPNDGLMYRLETHTQGLIPALLWWRIAKKEAEHHFIQDHDLQSHEAKQVGQPLRLNAGS